VHFHIIPKPNAASGLIVGWPAQKMAEGGGEAMAKAIIAQL
jgi:diadenosine tetraphosphate (Ap4A) HIT family hydrolase